MNFLTTINNQIRKEEEKYENEFDLIFRNVYRRHKTEEFINEKIAESHKENHVKYIEKTFLFNNKQYDQEKFHELREIFLENILNNSELSISICDNNPIELVLCAYFYYINKSINENQLYSFIKNLLNDVDVNVFLYRLSFISDYKLYELIVSFSEEKEKEQKKLHKNKFIVFMKKNLFLEKNKHKDKHKLGKYSVVDLFINFLNLGMIESCEKMIEKHPFLLNLNKIIDTIKNIQHRITNDPELNTYAILSYFYNDVNYCTSLSKILSIHFNNNWYLYNHDYEFNPKEFSNNLKNNLFKIYKNIICNKIMNNSMDKESFVLFKHIYCIANDLFDKAENKIISDYFKRLENIEFINLLKEDNNLNSVFLFLLLKKDNSIQLKSVLNNNNELIKKIISINFSSIEKSEYEKLKLYTDIRTIFIVFSNLIKLKKIKKNPIRLNKYYIEKIFNLDIEIFNLLKEDYKDSIFEEIYINNQISNF